MAAAAPKTEHKNIYEALAAFQAEVPLFKKDSTAQTNTYSYSYAGLDVLVEKVVPQLGKQGIAWVCVPTMDESGRLQLKYGLYHGASDTSIEGVYPLPSGTPQQVGSAVTYARRYGLLSMTGTFPSDEDDDGKAAAASYQSQRGHEARQSHPQAEPSAEPQAPQGPAVTSEQINAAQSIDELRDIYRQASPNGGLDRILETGEAVRDAITSRRMKLAAAAEAVAETSAATHAPEVTDAEAQQALSELGAEPVGNE